MLHVCVNVKCPPLFLRCIHLWWSFYKVGLIIPCNVYMYMYVFSSFYLQGERTLKVSTNCDMKCTCTYMCSVVSYADMKLIARAWE